MKPVDGSRDDEELLEKGEAGPPSDWSRDGRYILRARQRGPGNDDIWALPLDGNRKAFQVVESPFNEGNGQFSPDGKWIAFQSDESGQMEIYVQPFPGPARKTVITNGGGAQARWREDGRELFYLTHDARLMVVPTRTDSNPPVVGKPTLLFRTHPAFNAAAIGVRSYAVSPDGQRFLEATALVNEAYLRLIDLKQIRWQDRAHFFAMSSRVMRRILVDAARAKRSDKRGGDAPRISLDEELVVSHEGGQDLVALDDALQALAHVHPRKSEVVEMRFFGGLSLEETAEALHVSPDTVKRDWRFAKLWLLRELSGH